MHPSDLILHLAQARLLGRSQALALRELTRPRAEEREGYLQALARLVAQEESAPRTYDQDGKGDDAIVHFHLFGPSFDVWVTELDRGAEGDPRPIPNRQAFGLVDLQCGPPELGYVSLEEFTRCGAELDLHWKPKRLGDVRAAVG